jgi:hypothetical protein
MLTANRVGGTYDDQGASQFIPQGRDCLMEIPNSVLSALTNLLRQKRNISHAQDRAERSLRMGTFSVLPGTSARHACLVRFGQHG